MAPRPELLTRLSGHAAKLAELAATPLVPADYVDLVDPLWSTTNLRGRITETHPETQDATTLVIRPGRGWKQHTPGQHVRLGVDVDGVRHWRTYSLTSHLERADGCISITAKTIPGGTVSNHLARSARPGHVVQLGQAAGDFTLPSTRPRKVLYVTAGSGITPVIGMLRNTLGELEDVTLVHSAPTADDVIFGEELRDLAANGKIRLLERHTRQDGRLRAADLEELVPDLAERETWACGPGSMLEELEKHYAEHGTLERLHTERFRVSLHTSLHETGDGGTVTFTKQEVTFETDGATALLTAGENAGALMPSGCRMGICYGCVVPLRSGSVRDLRDGTLTSAAEDAPVPVQTCINAAAGTCDIEL